MLALSTARKLKDAGLAWKPALHDFFAVIWLPTEEQLRDALEQRLELPALKLVHATDGYQCEVSYHGQLLAFRAADASGAYAEALLHALEDKR